MSFNIFHNVQLYYIYIFSASYPLLSYRSDDPLHYHLDNVHCIGNEIKLSDCDHQEVGVHNCLLQLQDAGVVCTSKLLSLNKFKRLLPPDNTCEHGTVHLVGSDDISRGRVEHCYEGSWYSVCATDWGEEEVRVVCETLGYSTEIYGKVMYTCDMVLCSVLIISGIQLWSRKQPNPLEKFSV